MAPGLSCGNDKVISANSARQSIAIFNSTGHNVLLLTALPLEVLELRTHCGRIAVDAVMNPPRRQKLQHGTEGEYTSVVEIQNEIHPQSPARNSGNFARLVWIPADIQVRDARQQQKVLDSLRFDNRLQQTTDLLETSLEDLRTVYHDRLKRRLRQKLSMNP